MRQWLVGKQLANLIIRLDICDGVGAGGLAYRVLIHEFNGADHTGIALNAHALARTLAGLSVYVLEVSVQHIAHQSTLARSAHTRDNGHHVERELYVYAVQIVLARSNYLYIIIPRSA